MPGIGRVIIHQEVGDFVGRIDDAFDASARDAVAHAAERRADDAAVQRDGRAVGVSPPQKRV